MNTVQLNRAREKLRRENFYQQWNYPILMEYLDKLASMFERATPEQHRELVAQFHNCAGKLPYVFDEDFGALVLESVADGIVDKELQVGLYTEVLFRASWCVQAGTSGGESLARQLSVKRLEEKLRNTKPSTRPPFQS